jgi:hypothetical protein
MVSGDNAVGLEPDDSGKVSGRDEGRQMLYSGYPRETLTAREV